jgi:hypothetical protein
MRAFLSAVVIAAVLAAGAALVLGKFQKPAQTAFQTQGVRL